MADRLLIPASVPGDRLRLLAGWTGPAVYMDKRVVIVDTHDPLGDGPDSRMVRAQQFGDVHSWNVPTEGLTLDVRHSEVRAHIVDALATAGHDCRWMLHYHDITPGISADDSASLIACSVARVRAGLEPVQDMLQRWEWTDLDYGAWARMRTRGRGVWSPGNVYRTGGSAVYTPMLMERAEKDVQALAAGFAFRNPDGTLTLPWPDEVSP